jgi:hypothetical protein
MPPDAKGYHRFNHSPAAHATMTATANAVRTRWTSKVNVGRRQRGQRGGGQAGRLRKQLVQ